MSWLDALLVWPPTAETLRALLQVEGEERLRENLFFEFKSEHNPEKSFFPKTAAAFANASGGYIFWGAEERDPPEKGVLRGFRGIRPDGDLLQKASNQISQISPLPVWTPWLVPSPDLPDQVVVVVRVEKSTRPPHITPQGTVYRRTPAGSSDPITDRASLDRLVDEGREGARSIDDRLRELREVHTDATHATPASGRYRFSVVSVPVPFESARRQDLLTRSGFLNAEAGFNGPHLIDGGVHDRVIREDAVDLDFARATIRLFDDGALKVWTSHPFIASGGVDVDRLAIVTTETLEYHASRSVREAAFSVALLEGGDRQLVEGGFDGLRWGDRSASHAPNSWQWDSHTLTTPEAIRQVVSRMRNRLWRATGTQRFEDDPL